VLATVAERIGNDPDRGLAASTFAGGNAWGAPGGSSPGWGGAVALLAAEIRDREFSDEFRELGRYVKLGAE